MEEIEGEVKEYFKSLFTSSDPQHFESILDGIPQVITGQMNSKLVRPMFEEEIRKAIFSL